VEQGLTGLAQALGKEFTARVQKGRDGLGMTFQFPPDGNGLLIVDIEPEGKMAQHNAEQIGNGWEDLTIQPRMLITAVNGISGASEAMVEALHANEMVELRLRHGRLPDKYNNQALARMVQAARTLKEVRQVNMSEAYS